MPYIERYKPVRRPLDLPNHIPVLLLIDENARFATVVGKRGEQLPLTTGRVRVATLADAAGVATCCGQRDSKKSNNNYFRMLKIEIS